jgi:alpha-1,2-mannosyltransferase
MKALLNSAAAWLTPRRIRAQAIVLAICLWGVCAVDFAPPGLFDRAGNIKFQDFIQFPISARMIMEGRTSDLYIDQALADGIRAIVGRETKVYLQYFYGPQVALMFVPIARFSFLIQAIIWMTLSVLLYFACIYLLCKSCSNLSPHLGLLFLCAIAYPPLFHFFIRGQLSAVVLVCFTAACLAFLARRDWLAGIALGCLVFKPQFLVGVTVVLLLSSAWRILAGLILSAAAQLSFAFFYFGPVVMSNYANMLLHSASRPDKTELQFSPIQMHSLRSFWSLLIPWPKGVWVLYALSAIAVVALAAAVWKSSSSRPLRFSALILASVLLNPHIYIYDLVALIPAILLLADWLLSNPLNPNSASLQVLLYLAFILPLFGPLAYWTHLQLSVPAFAALLWIIWRFSRTASISTSAKLAPNDSRVV